ncbi:MAG: hypothetical protein ACREJO_05630 [Phycisphaerales bacterium]
MAERPATTAKKKPGRKRRWAGWFLLVLGVLITGVWGASAKWMVGFGSNNAVIGVTSGIVGLNTFPSDPRLPKPERGWSFGRSSSWHWLLESSPDWSRGGDTSVNTWLFTWSSRERQTGSSVFLNVILWPIALVGLGSGAGLLQWDRYARRRRAMAGHCRKCGYDLAGLPRGTGAPCPECGAATRPR